MNRQHPDKQHQESLPKDEVEAALAPRDMRVWWLLGMGAGIVLFVGCAIIAHKHTLTGPNLALFRHINNLPDSLRILFLVLTIAPSSLIIGAAGVVATFLLRLYQISWQLAAAVLAAGVLGMVAKKVIDEPRPFGMVGDVHIRVHEADPGFPSGHTLMITVVVLTLWPYLPRGWRWLCVLLIPVVGFARIYLGVHSALDIVGGVALGVALVCAMRSLPDALKRLLRFD
jgi:membrane-associated phospholipid phosphatase